MFDVDERGFIMLHIVYYFSILEVNTVVAENDWINAFLSGGLLFWLAYEKDNYIGFEYMFRDAF